MATAKKKAKPTILIHNVKNPNYRQIHVDGCNGNITPRLDFSFQFFAERPTLPKSIEQEINRKTKSLGKIVRQGDDSLDGVAREFEFGIYLDYFSLINIRDEMNELLEQHDKIYPKDK
ncbi:MAG: hypothetical protein JKY52_06190 [Flavobacteriales bacterium]|nr:hypothetical protein [Flavobacteriales bacterium]